mmetsp:Transcript_45049/g.118105  ORF Transcript_45049/g.118105 Transcript_45049/m.118105 type:complete len:290 (-) Transcript_45049:414-1283(-)
MAGAVGGARGGSRSRRHPCRRRSGVSPLPLTLRSCFCRFICACRARDSGLPPPSVAAGGMLNAPWLGRALRARAADGGLPDGRAADGGPPAGLFTTAWLSERARMPLLADSARAVAGGCGVRSCTAAANASEPAPPASSFVLAACCASPRLRLPPAASPASKTLARSRIFCPLLWRADLGASDSWSRGEMGGGASFFAISCCAASRSRVSASAPTAFALAAEAAAAIPFAPHADAHLELVSASLAARNAALKLWSPAMAELLGPEEAVGFEKVSNGSAGANLTTPRVSR